MCKRNGLGYGTVQFLVSCWDRSSSRRDRMNFPISSRASSSRVKGRATFSWVASRNWQRATPTAAFLEGRVVLVWVAASKSLNNLSVVASMSACQVCKISLKSSPVMALSLRNSTMRDLAKAWSISRIKPISWDCLEMEVVHLIHDLGHPRFHFLPF